MRFPIVLLALFSVAAPPVSAQSGSVSYRVSFVSTWSASTHPVGFPGNPHFSGLVGATHDGSVQFWQPGQVASQGVEDMAERGAKTALLAEVAAAGSTVGTVLSGGGITISPGRVELVFEIDPAHPYVSLVSMLAPSPDWFVGVAGLDLRSGPGWAERVEIELHVYDAGSDSGTDYTSPDSDTVPKEPVRPLTLSPFHLDSRVGTFVFERLSATDYESQDDVPVGSFLGAPWPNPASDRFSVAVRARDSGPVILFDILGRRVAGKEIGADDFVTLDVSGLPAGLYFVRVGNAGVRSVSVRR